MLVRPATDTDLHAIADIFNHAVRNTTAVFSTVETDVAARAEWAAARRARGFPVLVAEEGGTVTGFASYGEFRAFPGYRLTVEHSVYVAPDAQRRGAGRALLSALISHAEASGLHVMVGGIDAANTASLALHRALGFEETGRMDEVAEKFGRWLTLVFMQRRLDTRAPPPEAR
jgi:L-amino acid N-acyltransferase YncA